MIFSDKTEENLNAVMQNLNTELISDPGEILTVLTESRDNGTTVGICAPIFGNEIVLTAVEDVVVDQDVTIVLKKYDITGYILETYKLKLGDIASVCPFKSPFENPYMKTIKER